MDPLTLAAIGVLVQGFGAMAGGLDAQRESKRRQAIAILNAQAAEEAAADVRLRGEDAAALARTQASLDIADNRAAYGASGVDGTVGSPLEAMRAYRRKADLEVLTLRNNAAREAWGLRRQAQLASMEGKAAELRANNETAGTLLGGTGQLLSSGAKLYASYNAGGL